MSILHRIPRTSRRVISLSPNLCGCTAMNSNNDLRDTKFQKRFTSYYYTHPIITGMQQIFETVHDYTGLPWWATIVLGTFTLRGALIAPVSLWQQKNGARLELLTPMLSEILRERQNDIIVQSTRDGVQSKEIQKRLRKDVFVCTLDFFRTHGVAGGTAASMGVMMLQIPLFVTISLAIRNISGAVPGAGVIYASAPGIDSEGLAWFTDLTVADPYCAIPVMLLVTNTTTWCLHFLGRQGSPVLMFFKRFAGVMGVFGAGISSMLPAAIAWYWWVSSCCALLQHVLITSPRVRRMLNIPKTRSEKERPLKHVWDVAKMLAVEFVAKQKQRPW